MQLRVRNESLDDSDAFADCMTDKPVLRCVKGETSLRRCDDRREVLFWWISKGQRVRQAICRQQRIARRNGCKAIKPREYRTHRLVIKFMDSMNRHQRPVRVKSPRRIPGNVIEPILEARAWSSPQHYLSHSLQLVVGDRGVSSPIRHAYQTGG